MKQVGDYKILAHREAVWEALNDPDILGSCILGCESVEKIDETHFDISLKAKVGPVNAKMQVQVELTDLVPPRVTPFGEALLDLRKALPLSS